MAIKLTIEDKIFQWASGEFLTDYMSDEVVIGSDELMLEFIEEHASISTEYMSSTEVLNDICHLANSAQKFFVELLEDA